MIMCCHDNPPDPWPNTSGKKSTMNPSLDAIYGAFAGFKLEQASWGSQPDQLTNLMGFSIPVPNI
ncbi:MAG: hypothetical protein ACI97A_002891 [Planctomycetota bacterium]